MRFIVTGGAGFIGSSLVHVLLNVGHDVAVIDDLSTGNAANIDPRTEFRQLDIRADESAAFIAEYAPDVLVHLAAQSSVTVSIREPERDRDINARGTQLVARAAAEAGVRRVLSASSAAVYGEPAELPLRESSRREPINPYGASKLEAESLLADALAGTNTDHASLRFSNVYGPRQDAAGEGGVVAVFLDRIANEQPPVINGDGSQTRDFIYVGDVVGAILAAAESEGPLAREDGAAYNVSTGQPTSVNELVSVVRRASGYLGAVENAPAREGDIAHSVLDPGRAAEVFGWKAGTALERGLAVTWRWFSGSRS